MERECHIFNVLYCYYENGNKVYKEKPMWRYTEEDVWKDYTRWCQEEFGNLFVEIVRVKQIPKFKS